MSDSVVRYLRSCQGLAGRFLGISQSFPIPTGRGPRAGLFVSGLFLVVVGLLIVLVSPLLVVLALPPFLFGGYNLVSSRRKSLSLRGSNLLTLSGHLCAALVLYILFTRILWVTYMTDSIVGSYMGVLKVLALQNPYGYSIKPFLDQFSFPPSFYTPRIDGSFEFHLNYPALNFLTLIPLYAAGLHDLRDGVFLFHVISVLLIFGLVPSRQKALSIAPFVFFPTFVAVSWTDSVWAFFILAGAILWYKNRNLSLLMIGFAGATKQIALVVMPFLLIRLLQESTGSKLKNVLIGIAVSLTGFIGPNIPFMISSPTEWWAATIAPYFPGNTAQVPGGIGLSGVLLDIGIIPPPVFFVAIMSVVGMGSMYLYATRFSKSRYFVWIFPIIIMLLYYRSFPNYIVYWVFPVVFEFFKNRPAISLWHFAPIHGISWHPSMGSTLRSIRIKIRVPLVACLLLTTVFVGAFGAYASTSSLSRVEVSVNSIVDPNGIGAVTQLNLTLNNMTPRPVIPSFFIKWYILPYLWSSDSNRTLSPGSGGTFVVTATDGLAAIPRLSDFRIYVYDAITGNLVGESLPLRADISITSIANPQFRWWTLDVNAGEKVPFGWKLTRENIAPLAYITQSLRDNPTTGVTLQLNYSAAGSGLERILLFQKLFLNTTRFNFTVFDPIQTSTSGRAIMGLTVTDGAHQLHYIFSNATGVTIIAGSNYNSTRIVTIPASTWASISIDAYGDWQAKGWSVPTQVTLEFFLQANSVGLFSGSIRDLTLR